MDVTSENHLDFAVRVARIEEMRSRAEQILFVGVDEVYVVARRDRKPKQSALQRSLARLAVPFAVLISLALGMAGHWAGQVARFHVQGLADPLGNTFAELALQLGIGLVIVLPLALFLNLGRPALVLCQVLGLGMGLLTLPNALGALPEQFVARTSEEWVNAHSLRPQPDILPF